jgi:hypothetical protein
MESGVGKPALIFLRHWVLLGYVAKRDATDARSDSRHGGGSQPVTSTLGVRRSMLVGHSKGEVRSRRSLRHAENTKRHAIDKAAGQAAVDAMIAMIDEASSGNRALHRRVDYHRCGHRLTTFERQANR